MERADIEALAVRVSKGFDYLKGLEDKGDTGERYEQWFEIWEKLLRSYEAQAIG